MPSAIRPIGLLDPPECPVCGAKERDPRVPACWHCKNGDYGDCSYNRDVASHLSSFSTSQRRVWSRLVQLLPDDEILRRLGSARAK